jgi:hypothetical protein
MQLSLGYKLQVRVQFVDVSDNPVAAPAKPDWHSDDSEIVECVVGADGFSAWFEGLSVGHANVKISAGSFSQLVACEVVHATNPARMVVTFGEVEPL